MEQDQAGDNTENYCSDARDHKKHIGMEDFIHSYSVAAFMMLLREVRGKEKTGRVRPAT
jgi:hypothetical protein